MNPAVKTMQTAYIKTVKQIDNQDKQIQTRTSDTICFIAGDLYNVHTPVLLPLYLCNPKLIVIFINLLFPVYSVFSVLAIRNTTFYIFFIGGNSIFCHHGHF